MIVAKCLLSILSCASITLRVIARKTNCASPQSPSRQLRIGNITLLVSLDRLGLVRHGEHAMNEGMNVFSSQSPANELLQFKEVDTPELVINFKNVILDCQAFAETLISKGYKCTRDGIDNR